MPNTLALPEPKAKTVKPPIPTQNKKASDLDSANIESDDDVASCHDEVLEVFEPVKQDPKNCTIQEIYKEKEGLESFLFNESNKISRAAIRLIMNKWENLEAKLIETLFENEKAKTRINELLLENLKLERKAEHLPTYAEVLKAPTEVRTQPAGNLKHKTEVILVRPTKEDDKITNDEIKVNVTRALDKIKNKLKIKSIRQMNRKGLVIEVDSIKDKELIKASKLEEIGLKLEEPKRIKPMLILYDVEKEFKPEELKRELLWKSIDCVTEENVKSVGDKIEFKHCFSAKSSNRVN